MSRAVPHRLRPLLVTLLSTGWLLVATVGSPPASAHTELLGSDPADGSTLASLPPQLTVEFSEELRAEFARAQVRTPDGRDVETEPRVQGRELVVPMDTVSVDAGEYDAGEYTVDFRVMSADGHPVPGSVSLEVDPPMSATPEGTRETVAEVVTEVEATPVGGPLTPSESERPFVIVLAFLATAAVAVLAVVRLRRGGPERRRHDRGDDEDEPRP